MNPSTSGDRKVLYTVIVIIILVIAVIVWQFGTGAGGGSMSATSTSSTGGNSQVSSGGAGGTTQLDAFVSDPANTAQLINSAKVRIPNTGIDAALVNGSVNYAEGSTKGSFTVNNILDQVKVLSGTSSNATSSYDVFVNITMTSSTTQPVNRIGLFNITPNGATLTSSVVVGQKVLISGLTIGDAAPSDAAYSFANTGNRYAPITYGVSVHYLDRKNGEPMTATPTLAKDIQFVVKNHNISQ